jgi:DNA-binding IclR family transcriptional regulator
LKPPKKRTKSPAEESYQAPALTKGLEVLEFLSTHPEPYAISALARALGKSRNEIYRMVIVLENAGYLVRSDSDRFAITRKLFDVAMRAPPQRNLLAHALPEMERLSEETYQSCHLTVASETDIVVVARVESPATLGFSVRVGYRRPLNQSASGRVLYAFQNERGRAAWRALQPAKSEKALWTAVEGDAATIRESGYFQSPSPYVDAVTDIAAPVTLGSNSLAIAALVMPFIGGRSAKVSLPQATTATCEAARRISLHLS